QRHAELCAAPPLEVEGRRVAPVDIVVADLLHGPDVVASRPPRTALERSGLAAAADLVDDLVCGWAAHYVTHGQAGSSFVAFARRSAVDDPRVRAAANPAALRWLTQLDDEPAAMIAAALHAIGVDPSHRIDELRGHLARLAGWAGFAKWRNEWALPGDPRAPISPIELVAVRAAIEASLLAAVDPGSLDGRAGTGYPDQRDAAGLDARVQAVAGVLAPGGKQRDLDAIRALLAAVPADERPALWLDAQERCFDDRLLTVLDRVDPGHRVERPEAQAVFCIDVRSEGLRRHLEELGDVETFGFAGFFGVPMSVRRLGWSHEEPRCPVLVSPSMHVTEHPDPTAVGRIAATLSAERRRAGVAAAHDGAKKAPGAPFALAEGLGWLTGPAAAVRTLVPARAARPGARSTRMLLDDSVLVEQRVFAAESVLRTMGLVDRFAPVVLLCGHTSRTVNNAHASALDCGACGGAAGDDNAMAVAALLNSADVRVGLGERGIDVPDDTWFVAGVHDTASDHVTILDAAFVPPTHVEPVRRLEQLLQRAGAEQAGARARHLPGPAARVRDRGADWAQVRPEWGLARAAAFVIGPRSITNGIDLDGRAFLHGYDAEQDPTGRVLETIMTAPLVVAHWIASQYYFSTVDPEVFGAGDKLMHNPIGSVGVVTADGGDLRVGLPLQSTHVDGRRHHQPVRLLAVIQADLARIEQIIARHPILQTLVAGSWLRIAARSHPHEPWSMRTAAGTWITDPRPFDVETSIADDAPTHHAEMS
ncbi:MAG: putative inorganic carbon transporter subunit DabA, partial [Acidimicrobiia bacterium]